MAHHRRFRFGVLAGKAASGAAWAEQARKAEDLGYATLVMPDHFTDQFAPIPALMAAAAATTTLRVGTLVNANDFKHPAVLAKEAATIDVLSDGRFELGLGAGWMDGEYTWTGIGFDPVGTRIERWSEAVGVIRALWGAGPVTHHGTHYRIEDYEATPKPLQVPSPPILMGGGGKRVLSTAARLADIVGVNPNVAEGRFGPEAAKSMRAEATDEKLSWVRAAAGDRFDDLELSILKFATVVTDDATTAAGHVGKAMGMEPDDVLASPHMLVGSVDALVEELQMQRERWCGSYVTVRADAMEAFAPVVAKLAGS